MLLGALAQMVSAVQDLPNIDTDLLSLLHLQGSLILDIDNNSPLCADVDKALLVLRVLRELVLAGRRGAPLRS